MPNNKITFASLGVHKNLVSALSNEGIEFPFPIQAATLPEAINGRDVLGRGQTGSGKTLAFGLTVLTRLAFEKPMPGAPYALILAPTRELAMQIDDVLATYADEVGLRSTVFAGGMPYPPQLQALRKGVQIVVATPGRLQDHMKKGTIDLSATEIVVLDEADQMADMGFLPVVTEVLAQTPQDGQRLLFSATLDKDVDKLVKKFMKDPVTHSLAVTEQREADMDHHVLVVDSHVKDDVIAQIASREGRTIFFVRTKHGADRLTEKLKKQGVDAVRQELGAFLSESDAILDGGPCAVGLESTIIDCTGTNPKILRPGAITVEDIKGVTGLEVESPERSEIRVSGSLENHYAPDAQVLLDTESQPGDGFIALAEIPTPAGVIRLSAPKSLEAFAHDLYAALREGDAKEIQKIVVVSPHGGGIAIAIRDRLKRAAASK